MPMVIFEVFCGQPDEKRIDAAELIEKYQSQSGNKQIISHIVDQVWTQYDKDGCGALNQKEAEEFMRVVLQIHEKTVADTLGREIKPIAHEDILQAVKDCDINKDGLIQRDEMDIWLVKYMKNNEDRKKENRMVLEKKLSVK